MLDLRALPRAPEFCLDTLLACLQGVPDGFDTIRQADGTWELHTAWACIPVHPAYQCGFTEDGQGRLLTALLERMGILDDQVQLTTVTVPDRDGTGQPYVRTVWDASITLNVSARHPDASIAYGHARHDHPGVAVLIAYLRAWKVVAPDAAGPIQPS